MQRGYTGYNVEKKKSKPKLRFQPLGPMINRPAEWPAGMEKGILQLADKVSIAAGKLGGAIWLNTPSTQKVCADEAAACHLILLQKCGTIEAIQPKNSYLKIIDVARAHLDPEHGGIFRNSPFESPTLQEISGQHQEILAQRRLDRQPKSVIQVRGFEEQCSDRDIRKFIERVGGSIVDYRRYNAKPNKPAVVYASLPATKASAAIGASTRAWNLGSPHRIMRMPVRIVKATNQNIFNQLPRQVEQTNRTKQVITVSGFDPKLSDAELHAKLEALCGEKPTQWRRFPEQPGKTGFALAQITAAGTEKALANSHNEMRIQRAKKQNAFDRQETANKR